MKPSPASPSLLVSGILPSALLVLLSALLPLPARLAAQSPAWRPALSQSGFAELRGTFYPQTGPNDSGRAIGDLLLRYEMAAKLTPWLKFQGALDGRTDSHRQVERSLRFDWQDRGLLRPTLSFRRFSLTANRGPVTVEAGKQFIRWGKADLLNPLDRFAPRDFLTVTDNEYLAVMASRLTVEHAGNTLDFVWQPRFTPSRTPVLLQRWGGAGDLAAASLNPGAIIDPDVALPQIVVRRGRNAFPARDQWGLRWNHIGRGYEMSGVFFQGNNHLPLIGVRLFTFPQFVYELYNLYPQIRMVGAAGAVPLPWFTLKGESGYFFSKTPIADNYLIYVLQAERQKGEWTFVGGYAGEKITAKRTQLDFAPDRGLTRAFLGRASVQLNPNDALAVDVAVRQNGSGGLLRGEWSRSLSGAWSLRLSGALLRGNATDFFGQYRRNSFVQLALRYSF